MYIIKCILVLWKYTDGEIMPILKHNPLSPKLSSMIIDEIGQKTVAEQCSVTIGAVNHWKKRGIPKYRADFLKIKNSRLKVWAVKDV